MDVLQNEGTTVTRRQRADQTLVDGNDASKIKINPEEVLWEAAYRAWRKELKREKRSIGVAACKIVAIVAIFFISWYLAHWYTEPREFRPEKTGIDPFDALRATDSQVDIIDGKFGDGINRVVNEFDGKLEKKRREIRMRLNDLNKRAYVLEDVIGRLRSREIGGSYEELKRFDDRSDDDGRKS
ncbi:sensor histidine kinase [Striga asiatica]|uniref:Sensor histidine kinase n=1 Tax=Striga asiatica TaxID=4170 RepID=A0A5A7PPC7_STRAF|nr:sensor histidine kinase [Striga asiatica]